MTNGGGIQIINTRKTESKQHLTRQNQMTEQETDGGKQEQELD